MSGDIETYQRSYIRRAMLYIMALWGKHISVTASPCRHDARMNLPCIINETICLPGDWLEENGNAAKIRAASAHAAAHAMYGGRPFETGDLRQRQKMLIGLIEDARVEHLACQQLPGLRYLWSSRFDRTMLDEPGFPGLVRRLALALLDPGCRDANAWVQKGLALFADSIHRVSSPDISYEIGLRLAHDLGQMRLPMDEGREFIICDYRDDNEHLWLEVDDLPAGQGEDAESRPVTAQESVFLQEAERCRELELSDYRGRTPGDALWIHEVPEQAVLEYRKTQEQEHQDESRYPEWHYRLQLMRENWCTVKEYRLGVVHDSIDLEILPDYRSLLARLLRVVRSIRLEKLQRVRRQKEGDDVDLDAAIGSLGEMQAGLEPDPRVHVRARHLHDQGLASLFLLDVSESINDTVDLQGNRILDIARSACALLADTMRELDEPFAMQGFCSNTRKEVRCYNIKSFEDPMDDGVKSRIASLPAQYSTRMGAAIRHATAQLARQEQHRRLLLLVTDGVPSDVDVYDPLYLLKDAHHAVMEAKRSGVLVYALCLDPAAGESMSRIFGRGHFTLLDKLERLPEMLSSVFLRLVRSY